MEMQQTGMGVLGCESESWVCSSAGSFQEKDTMVDQGRSLRQQQEQLSRTSSGSGFGQEHEGEGEGEGDEEWPRLNQKKKKNQVLLEGYVESTDEDDLARTKSLTDDDLDELKGCLDLGFGFSYDEIPELCNTLPALELCYSMSQKYMDEHQKSPDNSFVATSDSCSSVSTSPIANWRISSPGDHPEDVKARLKFWAQAVACTVRLCS